MFNEAGELIFIIGGVAVALLLLFRMRRLSAEERNPAVAAAFGGVGLIMSVLACNSLGVDQARHVVAN